MSLSPEQNGLSLSGSGNQCKLQKVECKASDDRLSDLPLSIILEILDLVPIRDAVRTCVLSRQWRYTWTTLPHLVFRSDDLKDPCGKFPVNFITNVLTHHKGSINRFEIDYPLDSIGEWILSLSKDCIEEWIFCLSRNEIRELIINVGGCCPNLLKSSIYSCAKLTKLVLKNFKMDSPPSTFKGFSFLRSLTLRNVELSTDGIETLVGSCPLLERLDLVDGFGKELRIHSSNLKSLKLVAGYRKNLSLYAPLLVDMDVGISYKQSSNENLSSICRYTDFFSRFPNLVKLRGYWHFTRYLSFDIASYRSTLVFHHLKALYLEDVEFRNAEELAVVAHLIVGAPNLEKLKIETGSCYEVRPPDVVFKDFRCAPSFTHMKLTDVSLSCVCNFASGRQFVKFLLETSPALKTMDLKLVDRSLLPVVSAEVLGFPRASPNAKITVTPMLKHLSSYVYRL